MPLQHALALALHSPAARSSKRYADVFNGTAGIKRARCIGALASRESSLLEALDGAHSVQTRLHLQHPSIALSACKITRYHSYVSAPFRMREMRHIFLREQQRLSPDRTKQSKRTIMSYAAHRKDFGSLFTRNALSDGALVERELTTPAKATESRYAKIRRVWADWSARRRLERCVAHLDDRLLADIGLNADYLSVTERLARRQAASLTKFLVS